MDIYEEILATLEKQLEINVKLLELAKQKTQVLKDNDTPELMELSQSEERLVRAAIDAEKQRGKLVAKLNWGKDKLENIVERSANVSEDLSRKIQTTGEQLKAILGELELINSLNNKILGFVLEQIEFTKNILLSDDSPTIYKKDKGNYASEARRLDKKLFEDKF